LRDKYVLHLHPLDLFVKIDEGASFEPTNDSLQITARGTSVYTHFVPVYRLNGEFVVEDVSAPITTARGLAMAESVRA
jgi:hypothetical protein